MARKLGPQTPLARVVNEGVLRYKAAREPILMSAVYARIQGETGLGSSTVDRLRCRREKDEDYSEVLILARCLMRRPSDLSINWLRRLFHESGLGAYAERAARKIAEDLEDTRPELLQQLGPRRNAETPVPGAELTLPVNEPTAESLREDFLLRVLGLAWEGFGAPGGSRRTEDIYVHSRIVSMQARSGVGHGDITYVEDLLQRDPLRAAIIGPAGSGKSTLWRYLVRLLCNSPDIYRDLLPVPIDWADIEPETGNRAVTPVVLRTVWPDCPADQAAMLGDYLAEHLRQGRAIALIDNWGQAGAQPRAGVDRLLASFSQWRRMLVFSRRQPAPARLLFDYYKLPGLDFGERRRCVWGWSAATGRPLDGNRVTALVEESHFLFDLAATPLYLDLICEMQSVDPHGSLGRWKLVNSAVTRLVTDNLGNETSPVGLRTGLARVAWHGFRPKDIDAGVRFQFDAAELEGLLRARVGGHKTLLLQACRCGLLEQASDDQPTYMFHHRLLQAALAAEEWLRQPNWLEYVPRVKSSPPWGDVIVFAAGILSSRNDVLGVQRMIECLCEPEGTDLFEQNWLLAGRCLAEVGEDTRNQLEYAGIGGRVRRHLLEQLFGWAGQDAMEFELGEVLARMRTEALVTDLSQVVLSQSGATTDKHRAMAIDILGWLGGDRVRSLVAGIVAGGGTGRGTRSALCALANLSSAEALRDLGQACTDEVFLADVLHSLGLQNSRNSARALAEWEPRTGQVESAIRELSNPDTASVLAPQVVRNGKLSRVVLGTVARIGRGSAVELIRPHLYNSDRHIFEYVVRLLADMRSCRACQALVEYSEDATVVWVRRAAALRRLPRERWLWDSGRVVRYLVDLFLEAVKASAAAVLTAQHASAPEIGALINDMGLELGEEGCGRLENALLGARGVRRTTVVEGMALMCQPRLMPALRRLVSTGSESLPVQVQAVYGLARSKDAGAVTSALQLLSACVAQGASPLVVLLCRSLGILRDRHAVAALVPLLQYEDDGFPVARETIRALGRIGGSEATQALVATWQNLSTKRSPGSVSAGLSSEVLEALVATGDPSAADVIVDAAAQAKSNTEAANLVSYLERFASPADVGRLVCALSSPAACVRAYAASALGRKRDETALPALLAATSDPDGAVRGAARCAVAYEFAAITNPEALRALVSALSAPEPDMRLTGVLGLMKCPQELATPDLLEALRQVLMSADSKELLERTVECLGVLGGEAMASSVCNWLSVHYPSAEVLEDRWVRLARPEFLCALLDHLPGTRRAVYELTDCYHIRLMLESDGEYSMIMANGRKGPCRELAPLLD